MTKERQTQIMKPIKVLSLVLLALLLLVPAASAETYTLIDETLYFGVPGPVGDVPKLGDPNVFGSISGFEYLKTSGLVSNYYRGEVITGYSSTKGYNGDVSALRHGTLYNYYTCYYVEDNGIFSSKNAGWLGPLGGYFYEREIITPEKLSDAGYDISSYTSLVLRNGEEVSYSKGDYVPKDGSLYCGYGYQLSPKYSSSNPTDAQRAKGYYDVFVNAYDIIYDYASDISISYPESLVLLNGGVNYLNGYVEFSLYICPLTQQWGELSEEQHVTVTYDDQTSDYTVAFDETTFDRDISVTGYLLGVFPLHSTGIGWKLHSDAVSYTVPARFLTFDLDYTAEVVYNDDRKSVSWNLESLPETVTPPEPEPPSEPDLPDEPDPPDPTEPPEEPPNPPWYDPSGGGGGGGGDGGGGSFNGETFRESFQLPDSVYDLLNFDIKQIRSDLLSEIPIFEDIATGVFDGADALYGILFGFIAGTLVFIFEPVYGVLDWVSGVVEWFYDLCLPYFLTISSSLFLIVSI